MVSTKYYISFFRNIFYSFKFISNPPDATHNCTAYVVSDGEGFDDDGEPGGTAGRPMLNVLKKNKLTKEYSTIVNH